MSLLTKLRTFIATVAVVGAIASFSPGRALGATTLEEASAQEIVNAVANKTTRGIANVATGWGEFPKQIYITFREDGVAKGLFVGPLKGVGMTIVRTFVGAFETVTFFYPLPGFYDPLIKPNYVWQKE